MAAQMMEMLTAYLLCGYGVAVAGLWAQEARRTRMFG